MRPPARSTCGCNVPCGNASLSGVCHRRAATRRFTTSALPITIPTSSKLPAAGRGSGRIMLMSSLRTRLASVAGRGREKAFFKQLKRENPGALVLHQRTLRNSAGKKVLDPITGKGRRIDFAVVKDGRVIRLYEVTSLLANKNQQILRQTRIVNAGGSFIRLPGSYQLLNIRGVPSEIVRMP